MSSPDLSHPMSSNVSLYPYYYAFTSFLAWMPIFFLYFSEALTLQEVLQLEAAYYIAVVLLEVPTGYLSDRVGRRLTLVIGSIFLCLACLFYLLGGSFLILLAGQICFALHMSFVSGTNTVFLYESLDSISQSDEYGHKEAHVYKYGMIASGTAALLGGYVATYDLKYAYWLTLVSAVVALAISWRFVEPSTSHPKDTAHSTFWEQMKVTLTYLHKPKLAWLFAFYVIIFIVSHVPYEFYQPYLQVLHDQDMTLGWSVTIVSGLILAGAKFVGAWGAAHSIHWSNRIGLYPFLMICLTAILALVGLMGSVLHTVVGILVISRSLPWAAIKAPINAIITPAIASGQRATYHSIMSLCCRLGFFTTLYALSLVVDTHSSTDWPSISQILLICFVGGIILMISLIIFKGKLIDNHKNVMG